ncbi:DsbA family protein [Pikeienuella piscinae]|uniref:DsbA family protein n=1 Tax=Pikeienuella piscinae TaxID=2748098 RepID=A0A7L5BTV5_9RHOB|nr:DsbA family protein [Pikeienuella piscinae]QIE54561.1 DsbA family protein [Pikeienuella piscinae]
MPRLIIAALIALCAAFPVGAAEFSTEQKAEIDAMIRAYILENPEILVEAMQVLEKRHQDQTSSADRDKIAASRDAIFDDGFSHVVGNPEGDVTVVEFLDYRCPYCKRAHESVEALLEADSNVRVIVKEFPILGPESTFASRVAMAAMMQSSTIYEDLNDAMMEHKGNLDEATVFALAKDAGADIDRLREDMQSPEIAENIRRTYALARELEINGTPGFIIGDQILRGYAPYEQLHEMVEAARSQG